MNIYAFTVALWFMAVALFLVRASIRFWYRSSRERPVIDPSASLARKRTRTIRL